MFLYKVQVYHKSHHFVAGVNYCEWLLLNTNDDILDPFQKDECFQQDNATTHIPNKTITFLR
ncbi:hypothetical protein BDFB_012581 [Asbolus verrucosus]|uniref:Uncharacterized protein n=1 Tax=Asbolus verrucosus TaxID=1661398 RepID=A0A482VIL5_ASBVE|nr:hypothetical protein BDFB_012581 [Asbolus verrucosus]